jgi:FkbM family methyltransferase
MKILDSDLLARPIDGDRTVADVVFNPVREANITPAVVDAGARNGFWHLSRHYVCEAELISFEPNPIEYEKLAANNTDIMAAGWTKPIFRRETIHDCALTDADDVATFNITAGIGACTLMELENPAIPQKMFLNIGGGISLYDRAIKPERQIKVRGRRLDGLIPAEDKIDFLKMDIEGAELKLLNGASDLIRDKRILVIKTEVSFVRYFKDHALFSDIYQFLDKNGFRLIDLDLDHPRYVRRLGLPADSQDVRAIYGGDAFFVLDPDRNKLSPIDLQRMGAVLIAAGYSSFGLSLLHDAALTDAATLDAVERALAAKNIRGCYEMIARTTAQPVAFYRRFAELCVNNRDPVGAATLAMRALALEPSDAPTINDAAQAIRLNNHAKHALTWCRRAERVADDAGKAACFFGAGLALLARGDSLAALASLRAAVALNPSSAPSWRMLADLAAHRNEPAEQTGALWRLLQLNPSAGIDIQQRLLEASYKAGRMTLALDCAERVLAGEGKNPLAWRNYIHLLRLLGRNEDAAKAVVRMEQATGVVPPAA